jgi:RNA polymerase sigma-70 factor, ECF subfamily
MKTAERENLFRQWLADHTGLMIKVVRAFAASAEDQDDLFQEVLLQVWISTPAFRERAKPSTWIYRVALNTALNWHRGESKCRQSSTLLTDVRGTADALNCSAKLLEQKELLDRLYGEIRKLRKVDGSLILM